MTPERRRERQRSARRKLKEFGYIVGNWRTFNIRYGEKTDRVLKLEKRYSRLYGFMFSYGSK